jgi:hypothetical protein
LTNERVISTGSTQPSPKQPGLRPDDQTIGPVYYSFGCRTRFPYEQGSDICDLGVGQRRRVQRRWSELRYDAAIHHERLASDEPRAIGAEEGDGVGYVFGLTDPP